MVKDTICYEMACWALPGTSIGIAQKIFVKILYWKKKKNAILMPMSNNRVSEWVIWGLTLLWHYFGLIVTRTRL